MRRLLIAVALAGAVLASRQAVAADNQAGIPLTPADAAGAWTLESGGRSLCVLYLGKDKAGAASFGARVPSTCDDALPAGIAAWAPAADGMSLLDAHGQVVIGFHRWSNSLFVSHRSSGEDVQLKRGGPEG
ncbi:MAG TPA: AprI/Inh family metalloprotease inhibitor [Caulobacteraceae bacterium]|jgi:hypothetical protein